MRARVHGSRLFHFGCIREGLDGTRSSALVQNVLEEEFCVRIDRLAGCLADSVLEYREGSGARAAIGFGSRKPGMTSAAMNFRMTI